MPFVNETGLIAGVLQLGSNDVTGNIFATLFLIFIILLFLALAFRIPIEYAIVLLSPLVIVMMAYYTEWYVIGGLMLIMLAFIFARNFFVQPR